MIMLKIALRNILRQKRRSTLTALSMFGGFVLAAFFIGFSEGTYNDIINKFTRSQTGHIQVHRQGYLSHPSLYKTIDQPERVARILAQTAEVESWAPRLYSAGLASLGEKSTGVRIIGIDPGKEASTTNFAEKIISGSMFAAGDAHAAMVGRGLARLLHAAVGQEAVIVSQAADGSIANDRYRIVAVLESGDEIGDRSSFYLPLAAAQELLVLGGRIHEIAVTARSLHDVDRLGKSLGKKIAAVDPRLSVEPWQEFARSFYIAMRADKAGMWISLLIIVLVVAVGVLNTVLMSVLERRREYGLLKAVGTRPGQIIKMVLLEVNILGVICIVLGSLAGLLLNYIFSIHGISMPEPMTYGGIRFQQMFTEINVMSFTIPAVTVFFSATLVGFFPALKAARTDPARSMRIH